MSGDTGNVLKCRKKAIEKDNVEQQNEEIEDRNSKETRLTLMEEVLLLGLKDREVKSKFIV